MSIAIEEFAAFVQEWQQDPCGAKNVLLDLQKLLTELPNLTLEYKCRPGVSYSLRAKANAQTERDFFAMVDVVDDDPEQRWLSVCFYADYITDPDERGDYVPGGLGGEDACCFNFDEDSDEHMAAYIAERLQEAAGKASTPGSK